MKTLKNFIKVYIRKIKGFFTIWVKPHIEETAWENFTEIIEGQKKGADIWGMDYPIPVSDTLNYKLLKRDDKQFVITSIESKILFFIPFTYDEYIIEIPWKKYTYEGFDAVMALKEIHAAENWNKGDEMKYTDFRGTATFEGCGLRYTFDVDSSNYSWMLRTGL